MESTTPQYCIGKDCQNPDCDGIFCPRSDRWNLANLHIRLQELSKEFHERAERQVLLQQLQASEAEINSLRCFTQLSYTSIENLYDQILCGFRNNRPIYYKGQEVTFSENRLPKRPASTIEYYTCTMCNARSDNIKEMVVSDCSHYYCINCLQITGISNIGYLQECLSCGQKDVKWSEIKPKTGSLKGEELRKSRQHMESLVIGYPIDTDFPIKTPRNTAQDALNILIKKHYLTKEDLEHETIQEEDSTNVQFEKKSKSSNCQCSQCGDMSEDVLDYHGCKDNHVYCFKCIDSAARNHNLCPICHMK